MIEMPVQFAGRRRVVKAAVVKGDAPLLLSRVALKALKASMNFESDELQLFGDKSVPMLVNEAGQYTINVTEFPGVSPCEKSSAASVDQNAHPEHPEPSPDSAACPSDSNSVKFNYHRDKPKDFWEIRPGDRIAIRHHRKPRRARFTPCHTQCPVDVADLLPIRCTHVSMVDQDKEYQLCDNWTDPSIAHVIESSSPWKGRTVFSIKPHVDLTSFGADSEH